MQGFDYLCPGSLEEVLDFLASCEGSARPLAGGTNLVPQLRWREVKAGCIEMRGNRPDFLVSLRRLKELEGLSDGGDVWRIGSMTKLKVLEQAHLGEIIPLLRAVAGGMASPEIRNSATVGGNLCNGSPAADLMGPAHALNARVRLASVSGERVVGVDKFYLGPHRTALGKGEIMTALELPKTLCSAAWGFSAYATRPSMGMTLASASVIAPSAEFQEARPIRLALTLSSGRPAILEVALPADLETAQDIVEGELQSAIRKQVSKIAACHYSQENPQVPAWYVERRAIMACRHAIAQAWSQLAARRGA